MVERQHFRCRNYAWSPFVAPRAMAKNYSCPDASRFKA